MRIIPIRFLVVMGVAACGKTVVGQALASRLGWDFVDADDFHPPENILKMSSGIPLDDDDRAPWLAVLRDLTTSRLAEDRPTVLACSALKERYRRILSGDDHRVRFVYLKGSYEVVCDRISARAGHFMPLDMLAGQFADLEEPADALTVDAALPVDEIVEDVVERLRELDAGSG